MASHMPKYTPLLASTLVYVQRMAQLGSNLEFLLVWVSHQSSCNTVHNRYFAILSVHNLLWTS